MWDLERTERLVTRLFPLILLAMLLGLAWMTLQHDPAQLSSALTSVTPSLPGTR
ncbi:hypothetical protein [Kallotenue papyrolyticum]|uniref:hypothetical protein n=1 Tax=Kallotenue papyrolyticum TaxID=1325125 RepID=UPI0004B98C81|nr:hypothetical protein [Kallotenue papyrolyticum]